MRTVINQAEQCKTMQQELEQPTAKKGRRPRTCQAGSGGKPIASPVQPPQSELMLTYSTAGEIRAPLAKWILIALICFGVVTCTLLTPNPYDDSARHTRLC